MDSASSTIKLLLIEDQYLLRQGLELQIRSSPRMTLVASAENPEDAIRIAAGESPDVAILGADLRADAFSALGRLRTRWPAVRSILLLGAVRDALVTRAQAFAIDGIVTKYDSFENLCATVHAVARGRRMFSRRIWSRFDRTGGVRSPGSVVVHQPPKLTRREFDVLHHLAAGRTVKQTARELGLAAPTVDNHKTRLMKKLDVHSGVELTRYAIREGLISA